MLIIAGRVQVKPEGRAEAVSAALEMARATQKEAGCHSYRFYADLEDPNTFFIFEEWENEQALAQHFQTEHMATFQRQLPRFVAGPVSITRHDVASSVKMM